MASQITILLYSTESSIEFSFILFLSFQYSTNSSLKHSTEMLIKSMSKYIIKLHVACSILSQITTDSQSFKTKLPYWRWQWSCKKKCIQNDNLFETYEFAKYIGGYSNFMPKQKRICDTMSGAKSRTLSMNKIDLVELKQCLWTPFVLIIE